MSARFQLENWNAPARLGSEPFQLGSAREISARTHHYFIPSLLWYLAEILSVELCLLLCTYIFIRVFMKFLFIHTTKNTADGCIFAYCDIAKMEEFTPNNVGHTAWIWIWMTKRQGTTFVNGFIFKKINENLNIKEKKDPVGGFWNNPIYPLG